MEGTHWDMQGYAGRAEWDMQAGLNAMYRQPKFLLWEASFLKL